MFRLAASLWAQRALLPPPAPPPHASSPAFAAQAPSPRSKSPTRLTPLIACEANKRYDACQMLTPRTAHLPTIEHYPDTLVCPGCSRQASWHARVVAGPAGLPARVRTIDPSESDAKAGNHSSAAGQARRNCGGLVRPRHGRIAAMVASARRKLLGGNAKRSFIARTAVCGAPFSAAATPTPEQTTPIAGTGSSTGKSNWPACSPSISNFARNEQPPPSGAPDHAAGGPAVVRPGSGPSLAHHHQAGQVFHGRRAGTRSATGGETGPEQEAGRPAAAPTQQRLLVHGHLVREHRPARQQGGWLHGPLLRDPLQMPGMHRPERRAVVRHLCGSESLPSGRSGQPGRLALHVGLSAAAGPGLRKNAAGRPDGWLGEFTLAPERKADEPLADASPRAAALRTWGRCRSRWTTTCDCSAGPPNSCGAVSATPFRRIWPPCSITSTCSTTHGWTRGQVRISLWSCRAPRLPVAVAERMELQHLKGIAACRTAFT